MERRARAQPLSFPRRAALTVLVGSLLAGCVSQTSHSPQGVPRQQLDKDTTFTVEDRPAGFRLSIDRARYQFVPDFSEMRHACRTTATSVAHDVAAQRGRRLKPIAEDRVRVDTSRNILTGVSYCAASVTVEYQ